MGSGKTGLPDWAIFPPFARSGNPSCSTLPDRAKGGNLAQSGNPVQGGGGEGRGWGVLWGRTPTLSWGHSNNKKKRSATLQLRPYDITFNGYAPRCHRPKFAQPLSSQRPSPLTPSSPPSSPLTPLILFLPPPPYPPPHPP